MNAAGTVAEMTKVGDGQALGLALGTFSGSEEASSALGEREGDVPRKAQQLMRLAEKCFTLSRLFLAAAVETARKENAEIAVLEARANTR